MGPSLAQGAAAARQAGRLPEAIGLYRRLTQSEPRNAAAWLGLGEALSAAGAPAEAIDPLRRAARLAPQQAESHRALGLAQLAVRDLAHAAASFRRAAAAEPSGFAHFLLGHALLQAGDAAGALPSLVEADRLSPDDPVIMTDLGDALRRTGAVAEAAGFARRAAEKLPDNPLVWFNLAAALLDLEDGAEAEAPARRALALSPGNAQVRAHLALALLWQGKWREAWPHWERRFEGFGHTPRKVPGPVWDGGAVDGPVYVHAEQGFGDTLMFARYAQAAAARAEIVLAVQPPLTRLLGTLPGIRVVDETSPPPSYAAQILLLSLPGLLDATPETIPPPATPTPDPAARAAWAARLAALPGRRIGVVWAGRAEFSGDRERSIPPALLAPLAGVPGVSFVSLQKGVPAPGWMADWTAAFTDFAETAALVAELDAVVAVDTAVAHLAGTLGVPVFLLNRVGGDWRWGARGETTPWYPRMTILRQGPDRDWRPVIAALAARLAS